MKSVTVPVNLHPRQIDDFGEDVERSRPGALYFVPGTVKNITDSEWEWLMNHHKKFALRLRVAEAPKMSRLAKEKAEAAAKNPKEHSPKDNMSKAKMRQQELLKKKNSGVENAAPATVPQNLPVENDEIEFLIIEEEPKEDKPKKKSK